MIRYGLPLLCALLPLGACATATQGTREGLSVNSEPAGARAVTDIPATGQWAIDGYLGCEPTPCSISVPRKQAPVVTVSKEGYQSIRFKVTSAVATSATSVPTGALVAGLPDGSHVVAGRPDLLKRIPVGGRVATGALFTFGASAVVDVMAGANLNLAPNPVTAILVPEEETADAP